MPKKIEEPDYNRDRESFPDPMDWFQEVVHRWSGDAHQEVFADALDAVVEKAKREEREACWERILKMPEAMDEALMDQEDYRLRDLVHDAVLNRAAGLGDKEQEP